MKGRKTTLAQIEEDLRRFLLFQAVVMIALEEREKKSQA